MYILPDLIISLQKTYRTIFVVIYPQKDVLNEFELDLNEDVNLN